jgi:homoserine dehydrogenase
MKSIGLIGFGCVGQGFYELLQTKSFGEAVIKKIAVRSRNKSRKAPKEMISYDAIQLASDPELDIIVEAIDDAHQAIEIARRALLAGKILISANKKMIASNMEELLSIQKETGSILLYEAAVCGAIPVVKKIDDLFRFEKVKILRGIFNGTSNFILTKLNHGKDDYQHALRIAQLNGFAEADPTSDVGGYDAMYKAMILAKHAFGLVIPDNNILRQGIEQLNAIDLKYARAKGQRIKLVPHLFCESGHLAAFVLPQFVHQHDRLYHVNDEFNALQVESDFAGEQLYYGRGAGSYPTAFALFSDLRSALLGSRYADVQPNFEIRLFDDEDVLLEVYIRFHTYSLKEKIGFHEVKEGVVDSGYRSMVGSLSIAGIKSVLPDITADGGVVIYNGRWKLSDEMQSLLDELNRDSRKPEVLK